MPVFVDDMFKYPIGRFRRMKMSHLIADTTDELLAMVDTIGVARKWIQHPGEHGEHFDIAMVKRELAIKAGAIAITYKQCGLMCHRRALTGSLGAPEDVEAWMADYREQTRQASATVHHLPCQIHCVDCEGADHHWMPDCDEETGEPVMVCKHCEATRPYEDNDE